VFFAECFLCSDFLCCFLCAHSFVGLVWCGSCLCDLFAIVMVWGSVWVRVCVCVLLDGLEGVCVLVLL